MPWDKIEIDGPNKCSEGQVKPRSRRR